MAKGLHTIIRDTKSEAYKKGMTTGKAAKAVASAEDKAAGRVDDAIEFMYSQRVKNEDGVEVIPLEVATMYRAGYIVGRESLACFEAGAPGKDRQGEIHEAHKKADAAARQHVKRARDRIREANPDIDIQVDARGGHNRKDSADDADAAAEKVAEKRAAQESSTIMPVERPSEARASGQKCIDTLDVLIARKKKGAKEARQHLIALAAFLGLDLEA